MDSCFVFDNLFEGIFKYDTKYNEFSFKVDSFSIASYPSNVRNIWYKCYPELLRKYPKLSKVYDKTRLMNEIENDELLSSIPLTLVSSDDIKERTFHKLFDQDAKFQSLTDKSDRKHYDFTYAIKYDLPNFKGLNIDLYLNDNLISIKQAAKFCDVIDIKYVIKWYNKNEVPTSYDCYKQFSNKELNVFAHVEEIKSEKLKSDMAKCILQHTHEKNITDSNLIKYGGLNHYAKFDLHNKDVVLQVLTIFDNTDEYDKIMTPVTDKIIEVPISVEIFNKLCQVFKLTTNQCLQISKLNSTYDEQLLNYRPKILVEWFVQSIELKRINHDNFNEIYDKHKPESKSRVELAVAWIKTYHEEPPIEIYVSPNETNRSGVNLYRTWCNNVNSNTVPMEMVNIGYWDFMMRNEGKKKNPNHTILYTFFSNTLENKIIFTKSDVDLLSPAINRYFIPVDYDLLKPFLHEELVTNDICTFTQVTKDDWEKIAGGRCDLDIVAFSEMKNIYRERTPLKEVLEYLINSIELKFNVEIVTNE